MDIPTLDARSLELESVLDCDCVAIGFSKSDEGELTFPIFTTLIRKIESTFQLNLIDELSFFAASGKAGEIFEIPVSAEGVLCQRLIFVGLGKQLPADMRATGAALGRKVRGISRSLFSLAAFSRVDVRMHAVALILGTYQWNQKSGPKENRFPKVLRRRHSRRRYRPCPNHGEIRLACQGFDPHSFKYQDPGLDGNASQSHGKARRHNCESTGGQRPQGVWRSAGCRKILAKSRAALYRGHLCAQGFQ